MRRFSLVCDETQAREIEALAREYGLTEGEVLEQLIDLGLEQLHEEDGSRARLEP